MGIFNGKCSVLRAFILSTVISLGLSLSVAEKSNAGEDLVIPCRAGELACVMDVSASTLWLFSEETFKRTGRIKKDKAPPLPWRILQEIEDKRMLEVRPGGTGKNESFLVLKSQVKTNQDNPATPEPCIVIAQNFATSRGLEGCTDD